MGKVALPVKANEHKERKNFGRNKYVKKVVL